VNNQYFLKIIFISIVFVFVFGLFFVDIRDTDFWWHLKTGEYIYQTHSLPETDFFAYTSLTKDPIHPESKRIQFILKQYWLAQLFFYWIYKVFGLQGITFLRALILTSIFVLIYRAIRREGLGISLSVALLIPGVIIFSSNYTGERPQLFTFLFAFLLIFLLEGFRQQSFMSVERAPATLSKISYYLFPIPIVMLIWANSHGGFVIGIIIIFGYLSSEIVKYLTKRFGKILPYNSLKSLTLTSIISVIVSFINPNGFNVVSILIELEKGRYKNTIIEAMSPFTIGIDYINVFLFFLLLFLSGIILLMNLKRLDLTDIIIFSGLTAMSFSAVRFIPFFTPVATLMIARYGLQLLKRISWWNKINFIKRITSIVFAVCFTILLIFATYYYELFKDTAIKTDKYPERAVKFLKENKISGNMFNTYNWGGFLIWTLYPDYKVFIDTRALIEDVYFQYLNILLANTQEFDGIPLWKAYLTSYNINFIITYSVDKYNGSLVPLIPALVNDPQWNLIYMDDISLIFIKESPENTNLIKSFTLPKEWVWNEVITEAVIKSKDSPNRINFFITIGDAFFAKKDYKDAKATYLKALRADPNSAIVNERLKFLKAYGY
jgi:hypothetical protein